ncbi:hypothetical protein TNIN_358421 [Trichonephila inaurata madagascariensis]|uniref:Uncharacterized protein n=1 Tax=Trichonephila inaurata madagascariensis TaxID=2747483 RepID=A0A8X6XQP2_9ARAC|nr:hypothetical protein TNIN_358421 [Trichonephila inaurata madagascariensis]
MHCGIVAGRFFWFSEFRTVRSTQHVRAPFSLTGGKFQPPSPLPALTVHVPPAVSMATRWPTQTHPADMWQDDRAKKIGLCEGGEHRFDRHPMT